MGFLQLIPASQLAAAYDNSKKELILYAKGNADQFSSNIHFQRDKQFVGGLKYQLMGWVGPLSGDKQAYSEVQRFQINLPSPVINSKSVIIATADQPNGQVVEIHYMGLNETTPDFITNDSEEKALSETAVNSSPNEHNINVLYKQPFTIKASCDVPSQGSVEIKFNKEILELTDARISGSQIEWTFDTLKMADTQIVITTSGGIAQYIVQETYNVRVFLPTEIASSQKSTQEEPALV